MIYNIFDNNDQIIGEIEANSYEVAEQEANCYVAENGIDREYEYEGYYIKEANMRKLENVININIQMD